MLNKNEIKLIKSLESKKFRKKHNLFIIEGERLVREAVISSGAIEQILLSDNYCVDNDKKELTNIIAKRSISSKIIPEHQMKSLSGTVTPSGILALCKVPEPKSIESIGNNNVLYLDTIQDPGNLGTLLRSANWFGVKQVVLSENCIDPYNPKVVRSAMGAHFNINIFTDIALNVFNNHTKIGGFQTGKSIYDIKRETLESWVLVIGNEANGINSENIKLMDLQVTIQKLGQGESLNAGVAGAILLYQLTAPL